ncbi:MAG: tetratricopeptide repeat protein [Pirellulaceae bacterium]|nr:tetratricopeptide repeat protein [Pirellulaceae bacterium]
MRPLDPIGGLFAIFGRIQHWAKRLGNRVSRLQHWLISLVFKPADHVLHKVNSTKPTTNSTAFKKLYGYFLVLATLPKQLIERPSFKKIRRSKLAVDIARHLSVIFHLSFVHPARWLANIAGALLSWVVSRRWGRIFLAATPSVPLMLVGGLVWWASTFDNARLAYHYLDMGRAEIESWQKKLEKSAQQVAASTASPNADGELTQFDGQIDLVGGQATVSRYCEMLFHRAQLLYPQKHCQFIAGISLYERGLTERARKLLLKIAPNGRHGDPDAHSVLAVIYWNQFNKTKDAQFQALFEHHAQGALSSTFTHPNVLMTFSSLLWQRQEYDRALQVHQIAAERFPNLNVELQRLATIVGDSRLAASAGQKAMEYLQKQISYSPTNSQLRVLLAQSMTNTDQGIQQAEAILIEGMHLKPDKALTRELSNIQWVKFMRHFAASEGISVDMKLIDAGLRLDPSNPNLIDLIAKIGQIDDSESNSLIEEMNRILASGEANVGAHAVLAEYNTYRNRQAQAKMHLEQVYQNIPHSPRYSSMLARLHANSGNLDIALETLQTCLSILDQADALSDRYGDELLDTLGDIYQLRGETSQAMAAYRRCIQIYPNHTESNRKLHELLEKHSSDDKSSHEVASKANVSVTGGAATNRVSNAATN